MNDKSHTTEGGCESQTPHNLGLSLPGLATQASLWNSPLGRRAFLKKTGAATVATAVAMHGFRVQVQAQQTAILHGMWIHSQTRVSPGVGVHADTGDRAADEAAAISLALQNAQLAIGNQPWTEVQGYPEGPYNSTAAAGIYNEEVESSWRLLTPQPLVKNAQGLYDAKVSFDQVRTYQEVVWAV